MANSDTFGLLAGGSGRNQLAPMTGLGTVETVLTMGTDSGVATNAFLTVPSQAAIIGSNAPMDVNANPAEITGNLGRPGQDYRGARPYFQSGSFDGHPFGLQLTGKFVSSAVAVAAHHITIYQATAANGPQLGTKNQVYQALSNATLAAGTYNFWVEVTLLWDSASGTLNGEGVSQVAGNYGSRSVITTISGITSYSNLLFFASVQFNSGATNTITPVEFSLSAQ